RGLVVPGDPPTHPAASGQTVAARWPALTATGLPVTPVEAWAFDEETARRTLLDQLRTTGLAGFGLEGRAAATAAAGGLLHYLRATQKVDLAHVRAVSYRQRADALLIDPQTLKHLDIIDSVEGGREGSLLDELDRTVSAMGSRLLRGC